MPTGRPEAEKVALIAAADNRTPRVIAFTPIICVFTLVLPTFRSMRGVKE